MHEYDVVIVGGGIQGAGVAQASAAAGYSVLLLEQTDIAAGTSSRSSKLIHGGLRYLESMQYALVRQSLHERRLMLTLAPELVRLVPFYIPVYKNTRRRPWQIHAGLSLYAWLGGLQMDNLFARVPTNKWDGLDGLETKNLQAVFRYHDGQTDDAALTHSVIRSAQGLGAMIALPARFVSANINSESVLINYQHNNAELQCQARVLVNAAGPWVNTVLDTIIPKPPQQPIELVRGTHIRVAGTMHSGNFYMEAPQDGRAVFAMPRDGSILVGTTETIYAGDPARVVPVTGDEAYLLNVLAHYFPRYRDQSHCTVLSSYAGLRVLPKGEGSAFKRSRETILLVDQESRPRLLSIYGGKLTTWRATAEKVIQRLSVALPNRVRRANTRKLMLTPD